MPLAHAPPRPPASGPAQYSDDSSEDEAFRAAEPAPEREEPGSGRVHDTAQALDSDSDEDAERAPILGGERGVFLQRTPLGGKTGTLYALCLGALAVATLTVSLLVLGLASHNTFAPPDHDEFTRTYCNEINPAAPPAAPIRRDAWPRSPPAAISPLLPLPTGFVKSTPPSAGSASQRRLSDDFWIATPAGNLRLLSAARRACATLRAVAAWPVAGAASGANGTQGPPLEGLALHTRDAESLRTPRFGVDESYSLRMPPNGSEAVVEAGTAIGVLR